MNEGYYNMKKLIYLGVRLVYQGEPIEAPQLSDEVKNSLPQ